MKNLNIKHYIKIGEPCSICYEPIKNKKDAFLTNCGHSFHTSCLYKYEHSKINDYDMFDMKCPVCRQELGDWSIDSKFKYYNTQRKNYIDRIEDFWTYKDIVEPLNYSEWNSPSLSNKFRKNDILPVFNYGKWRWQ